MSETRQDLSRSALLPAGLRDILAPNAANEARLIDRMMACAMSHGYDRVKPPLIEFETSLLEGLGAATGERVFRLMDPMSQRMMGIRADMTAQAARIAATRLLNAPRPVRLCYAGEVLRTTASQLNPEREVVQVGTELIGSATAAADAEIILLAIEMLRAVGVEEISLDLMVPVLVPAVLAAVPALPEPDTLRLAIDRKDVAAVREHGGPAAATLVALLEATGPREAAMRTLTGLDLPADGRAALERLTEVVDRVTAEQPELAMTLDPVENRGFEYHTGVAFSLFARGVRAEMGRGGRYRPNASPGGTATGFTLYMERVLQALPDPVDGDRVFVPFAVARRDAAALRRAGHVTVQGLEAVEDETGEAARLRCTHLWRNGEIVRL